MKKLECRAVIRELVVNDKPVIKGKVAFKFLGGIREFTFELIETLDDEKFFTCQHKGREFFKFELSKAVPVQTGKPFYAHYSEGKQVLIQSIIDLVFKMIKELDKKNTNILRFEGFIGIDSVESYLLAIKKLKSM